MLHEKTDTSSWPPVMPAPREIRALLLDDSNFDRARIRRLSNKTNLLIQMDEVDSLEQLDRAVATENYDVILIDYRLPVGNGLDALSMVSENALNRGAGKIMITGDNARETVLSAMRGGCHDFLTKDEMDGEALRHAILNAMQAAWQSRQLQLQVEMQKEIIRQGLVEAIRDREVQGNVISLVQDHLRALPGGRAGVPALATTDELEALLSYLDDEDEFIFH